MAKKMLLLTLISLTVAGAIGFRFQVAKAAGASHETGLEAAPVTVTTLTDTATTESAAADAAAIDACARPQGIAVSVCHEREQAILATTVRLALQTWLVTNGESGYEISDTFAHATIKDGRYLVTHNHFDIPLVLDAESNGYTLVTIYRTDGELIYRAPLSDFSLVLEAPETLVFDIGALGQVELAAAGLRSADFSAWPTLALEPGMEVAQLDWDGTVAHIDWVTVEAIVTDDGTPRLELDNFVRVGASGGPVFWNGSHVANNWARITDYNANGDVVRAYSLGALNPATVTGPLT